MVCSVKSQYARGRLSWRSSVVVVGAGLVLGAFLSRVLAEAPWEDNMGLPFQRSFREDREPLPAGEPAELVMDLFPTSTVFNAGHRLRVTIMGADADNLELPEVAPTYRVYRGGAHPSGIVLPVVR